MSQELLCFTHNDLDYIGSKLCIDYKFQGINKKYWNTNYSDIDPIVQDILQYASKNNNRHLIIADVSFGDNKPALQKLYDHFTKIGSITLIDHHLYADGFFDAFPDMKLSHDMNKCASLLCYEYFKLDNVNLHNMVKIIDIYDIWQSNHPLFDVAQSINTYAWDCGMDVFGDRVKDNNFKLPVNFSERTKELKSEADAEIKDLRSQNCIHQFGDISVCFINTRFNEIMIEEMEKGQNFVVGLTSYGIIRTRINANIDMDNYTKEVIREMVTGKRNIGHTDAFTFKMINPSSDSLMAEAERIVKGITGIRADICYEEDDIPF